MLNRPFSLGTIRIRVAIICRLRPTSKNYVKVADFFKEFSEFVQFLATNNDRLLILGEEYRYQTIG